MVVNLYDVPDYPKDFQEGWAAFINGYSFEVSRQTKGFLEGYAAAKLNWETYSV